MHFSCTILLISLLLTTLILIASSILVMADEFKSLPTFLKHSSSTLVHNKQRRTMFICSLISLMAFTSVISVVACPAGQGKYSKILVSNEAIDISTERPEDPGLDRLILSFLETALVDDAASDTSEFKNSESKIFNSLGLIDKGNIVAQSPRRRDYFRFCNFMN